MTAVDPAVRSVQIASALLDRLAELVRGASTATGTGLTGGSAAEDRLALRIGEAQQIAPEVWRHLDEARTALAGRGVDTSGFDAIRKERDPATLATSNVSVQRRLDMLGLARGQLRTIRVKTVEWDTRMVAAGVAACAALQAALPDVDWEALDRKDREQIAAVGSLRESRSRGIKNAAIAAAILGVLAAGIGFALLRNREEPMSDSKVDPKLQAASKLKVNERLVELGAAYDKTPCDRDLMRKYTAYLVAGGQEQKAREIEDSFPTRCPNAK